MDQTLEGQFGTASMYTGTGARPGRRQLARPMAIAATHAIEGTFQATLYDLTKSGLSMLSESCIPCGEMVLIESIGEKSLRTLECRIIRVQALSSSQRELFEYGLQISQKSRDHGEHWFRELRIDPTTHSEQASREYAV